MINIKNFDYDLPESRIAKFPLQERDRSRLLVFRDDLITEDTFFNLSDYLSDTPLVVINNTKVIRARLIFHKSTGARIEVFCLDPFAPADYERAFSAVNICSWHCIVGNSKRFKGEISINFAGVTLSATKRSGDIVEFTWNGNLSFGQILELLGNIPIPPYLRRNSEEIDNTRYQTTYAQFEGSVAAPTAGLHFTESVMSALPEIAKVTLHVGAGTFLPVKELDASKHVMHNEHFSVSIDQLAKISANQGNIIAVGTTSVRTLESLAILGQRIEDYKNPTFEKPIGQWEAYSSLSTGNELITLFNYMKDNDLDILHSSTQIMITPDYTFRTISGLITNFHQPQSTLLLLISAVVGDRWKDIYRYALDHDFRFLSYGDSSLLICKR